MAVRRLAEQQPDSFAFTLDNLAWAERTIAKFPEGRQASAVIPLLWRAQEQEGWITKPAVESVAEMLGMPLIRVLEVATFYTMFHLEPVGRKAHVQVCGTTPCMLAGSDDIIATCKRRIGEHQHERSPDGDFSWEEVECLGSCVNAPMVQVGKDTYEDLTAETFEALLDAFERGERPTPGSQLANRQYSAPINGLTSLTEVDYAPDDVPSPPIWRLERNGAARSPEIAGTPGEPLSGEVGNVGGEPLEAEQQRRKGQPPKHAVTGGTDPATPDAAHQEKARAKDSGRSDEAAARAMPGGDRGSTTGEGKG